MSIRVWVNRAHYRVHDSGLVTDDNGNSVDNETYKVVSAKAEKVRASRKRASANRKALESAYESCGLVRVKGAVSGRTYWE